MSTQCGVSCEPKGGKWSRTVKDESATAAATAQQRKNTHATRSSVEQYSTEGKKTTKNKHLLFIYTHADLDFVFSPLLNTSWQVRAHL